MPFFEKMFPARADQERRAREIEDLQKAKIMQDIFKVTREQTPVFSQYDLGDQPRETPQATNQALSEMFNKEYESPDARIAELGKGIESKRAQLSMEQKPELTISEFAAIKKADKETDNTPMVATEQDALATGGKITPGTPTTRGNIKLLAAMERTRQMAEAASGRQANTFEQQEKMAEAAEKRKPATESQARAALFANRVEQADPILEEQTDYVKSANPIWFTVQKGAPDFANAMRDPQFRQYDQARRNFLNSILRRESGAVISPTEFADGNRQYFPLPGDDEKTLEQKRQNRLVAIANLKNEGGKAYKPLYSDPIAVGAALQSGKISERQAKHILKRDFGFKD